MPLLELNLLAGPALADRRWRLVDALAIGRAPDNGLVLPDPAVSREHALIRADGAHWSLLDRHSRLGTRLNGLALEPGMPADLHVGDVIGLGPWRFRVDVAASAPAAPAPRGSLAEQRLELLLGCAAEIAAAADEQQLSDVLAEHALAGSGFARAAVLWRGEDRRLQPRSLRTLGADRERFERELARIAERLESGAREDPAAATRSLQAPLMLDGRDVAWLHLDSNRVGRDRRADAPTFVQALSRLSALALANLRRVDAARRHAMLAADLERARDVQRRLLPDARPAAGLAHALHLQPGRTIAGDIADVFELPGGKVAALLGDVAGAGLGAGLVMASVQSFMRAELAHHDDPARASARLNAHLCAQSGGGRFTTLWLGIFEPHARRCRFVDAGHGLALRLHPLREAAPIVAHGNIPLGISADAQFHAETLQLEPGEFVLLHSDGLIERRAPDGSAFGHERLVHALRGAATPAQAIARALSALDAHVVDATADDDTTLLALAPP